MSYQYYSQIRKHIAEQANLGEAPKQYVYFVYKAGEVIGRFESETQAKTECEKIGGVVEKVESELWDVYWNQVRDVDAKAFKVWFESFRTLWDELTDAEFGVCYAEACRRGESYGYDEVANYMYDVVYFMRKVQEITK